jgi:hypothetical protein
MAKRIFNTNKKVEEPTCSNETNKQAQSDNYEAYFALDLQDSDITNIARDIISSYDNYEEESVIENTEGLVYLPVFFTISYETASLEQSVKDKVNYNVSRCITRCNEIFQGNTTNRNSSHDGNWETPNNFHGRKCNLRFFLSYKIPKEFIYPFGKFIKKPENRTANFSNSIDVYKTQFESGIENIPGQETYISSYTYDDVKNKRQEVIDLSQVSSGSDLDLIKQELREIEDDYFFYFGDSPGVLFFRVLSDVYNGFLQDSSVEGSTSYQLRDIMKGEQNTGFIAGQGNSIYVKYAGSIIPGNQISAAIPGVTFSSSSSYYEGSLLGTAKSSNYLYQNTYNDYLRLATMYEHSRNEDLDDHYSSLLVHEFYHSVGYPHPFDGMTISGLVNWKKSDYNTRASSVSRQSGQTSADNYYLPFTPPFQYYDSSDVSQNLEDPLTLPDFETIDPNEKLFVESTIKSISDITQEFTISNRNFGLDEYGHLEYTDSAYNLARVKSEEYAGMFATISHLPTFWGGSYTTNADSSKSMLINPQTENAVSLEIGSLYKGGRVIQINEDNTALICVPFDLPVFSDTKSYTNWGLEVQKLNDRSYPYNVSPYETVQGSGWKIANLEELLALSQAVLSFPELPAGATDTWYSSSTASTYSHWKKCSRLISSNTGQPWGGNPWDGSSFTRRRAAFVKTVAVEVGRKGPNVTIYNPVCDKNDNTLFNYWLPFTLDWYNSEYPAFPENTRVEDMFSPELCPCLYTSQTKSVNTLSSIEIDFQGTVTTVVEEDITFTLFTPLIDELSGAEITTTTGTPINSADIQKLNRIYTSNPGVASSNANEDLLFQFFSRTRNISTDFYEYFGDTQPDPNDLTVQINKDRVWLKRVGDVILPNFPVYVGFMPESPLPAAFKFDASKFLTNTGVIEKSDFSMYSSINDSTVYNSWGSEFQSIIDKYIRVGSSDPTAENYNPFKLDLISSGLKGYIEDKGATLEEFETYKTISDGLESPGWPGMGADTVITFEPFFNRNIPTTTSPAIDLIGDTLHGPINQNTFTNCMYYNKPTVESLLPSEEMIKRLNYLLTLDKGLFSMYKQYTNDMYDATNQYVNVLPDAIQKEKTNTVQPYLDAAIDYLDTNRLLAPAESGCTDPTALNYDSNATFDDGTCVAKIFGCTDPESPNFNATANVNDGSCEYYSLVPAPVTKVYVCPKEYSSACNAYQGEEDGQYLVLNIDKNISETSENFETNSIPDNTTVKVLIEDVLNEYWQDPAKVAVLNKYRYSGGDCPTPLGTVSEGALNIGGGCVRVLDPTVCNFPDIAKYNCNVLSNVVPQATTGSAINKISFDSDISLLGVEITNNSLTPTEFINYFEALSETTNIVIGVCDNINI